MGIDAQTNDRKRKDPIEEAARSVSSGVQEGVGARSEGSENGFKSIFVDAPIGIYQSTMEGRFLAVNPRLVHMLGYDKEEELLRLDLASDVYYNPAERARVINAFLEDRVTRGVEVCWKKKSGAPLWVSLSTYSVTNPDGSVRYFEGFVSDMTLRKEAETRLLQREEYFRSIIENSVDAVTLVDAAGRIQYAVQKDAVGYKPQDIVGEPFFARIHPDDQPFVKEQFRELLAEPGGRIIIKARARRANGEWRHLEIAGRNLIDNPAVKAIVASFRDVTDRTMAEERLIESELRYRQLVEQASDGIIIVAPEGTLLYVNEKLCQMTGYDAPELVGRSVAETYPPGFEELAQANLRLTHSKPSQHLDRPMRRKDGSVLTVEVSARRLPNGNYQGIVRDITERKIAENALRQSEKKYRSLFEHLLNGFAYCQMIFEKGKPDDFIYLDVNESFERLTGLKGVAGKRVSEVIPGIKDTNPELLQIYGRVASSGVPEQFETYVEPLKMWFSISVYSPQQEYFVSVFDVITERKKAEQVLAKERNTLRTLIDTLPDRIYVKDRESRFLLNNRAHIQALGCRTQEEVLGKTDADFREAEVASKTLQDDQKVMTSGRPLTNKMESMSSKSGDQSWFLVTKVPLMDENGLGIGLVGITRDVTDLRKSEQFLRESEEKFRSLAEESPNMIFINKQEKVLYANKRCEEIMGYTSEELTSPSFDFRCLIEPESMVVVEKNLQAHALGENIAPYEYGLIKKNGEKVFGLHATRLINYEGGPAILGIITDVTEQRKAADTQRRLLSAVEQSHDVIFMTDVKGLITYVNPSFERVYGIRRTEALGKTPRILKSGIYSKEYYATFWSNLLEGKSRQNVFTNRTSDGRLISVEASISPVLGSAGEIIGFLAVQTDITQKKEAEDKVMEQAALLDIATDAIAVIDRKGNIQFWNKSAERLYGWPAADTLGRDLSEILACKSGEPSKALEETVTRGSWEGEFTTFSRNRRSVVVQSRWTLLRDEEGNPKSILVVSSDITERKVLQKQFYQSQRLDSLGTLAGGIAHDLNNVLSPILLSFEVLGKFVKEEQGRKLLKTALESANRGKRIVSQVLTFARGAEGRKGPVQIRHLIDEAVNITRETFPKSIEIESSIESSLWTINADPTQIHQVIMNLMVNARDAMSQGGLLSVSAQNLRLDEFFCRTQLMAHPGPYVVVTVTDTGSGIPKEIMERIFDPFFTTKEVGKGTGLGLSTVHTIVNSHQGFVDAASTVGHGSSFKVYIPASIQESTQELPKQEVQSEARTTGERILVVDDERAIREIAEQVLTSSGYKVTTAADGIEAIALFAEQNDYDLILVDLMMPMMDGVATVRALRRIRSDVNVIAMSGVMAAEKLFKGQDFKPQEFLAKPFTTEMLLQAIRKVLEKSR